MRKIFLGALVALFSFSQLYAAGIQPVKSLLLYPQGQNVDAGIVEDGVAVTLGPLESNGWEGMLHENPNREQVYDHVADGARIDIYLPEHPNGQMVVVCPGGGYWNVCSNFEGSKVAAWMAERGIATCVLIYRLPNHHCQVPLRDVQNAFRYCRHHAAEWGVRQIGVMGFSAGGHLAASASTLFVDDVTRPDFSVLVYPVITFGIATHGGTRGNLLPEGGDDALQEFYSLENRVTAATPPAFIVLSQDDKAVPPINGISYYQRMIDCGVQGELHIFTEGGHGWGFGPFEGDDPLGASQRIALNVSLVRWLESIRR